MNDKAFADRCFRQLTESREAGDLLARAVIQSNPGPVLAAAVFCYMEKEACLDAKFYAAMHLKLRLIKDLFTFFARRA